MSTRRPRPGQAGQQKPAQPQPTVIPIPPAALSRLRNLWQTARVAAQAYQEVASAIAETLPLPPGKVRLDLAEGVATVEAVEDAQPTQPAPEIGLE